jgi:hypothetical protein
VTAKRPVPRSPQDQARRLALLDASSGASGYGGLISLPGSGPCDCGAERAPHRGERRTTRVADGVVRDEHVYRCTSCYLKHLRGDVA